MVEPNMEQDFKYQLIDFGHQQRLESFNGHLVCRPAPQAFGDWADESNLSQAQAVCQRVGNKNIWTEDSVFPENWVLSFGEVQVRLKPSSHQTGVFPEQLKNWQWMQEKVRTAARPLKILNLFGYTGMASLSVAVADSHVQVTHVDGAKSTIKWAKENAELTGVENQIRWICEDVSKFVKKEVRRESKYDAIILDPPAFGRGPGGEWKIERDLKPLLRNLSKILSKNPLFVVLSCHHPAWSSADLQSELEFYLGSQFSDSEPVDLTIESSKNETFFLGICGRIFN
ncbi:SAM-dependent methyltransferase [bacterium DOLZORAL124_38_8]|nr:MAG: SAM-dependent methyltransferase [bacterium DOLZORAL124_38_8]